MKYFDFDDHKSWFKPQLLSLALVLLYNLGKLTPQMVGCLAPIIFYVLIDTVAFYAAVLTKISRG